MIEFFSLFLGLTIGVQAIELVVIEPVVEVEVRLDGRSIGTVYAEPWSVDLDLGDLAPHELVAVGRDRDGREIERIRQWINLAGSEEEEPAGGVEPLRVPDLSPVVVRLAPGTELPAAGEMDSWFLAGGKPAAVVAVEKGSAEVVVVRDPAAQPELQVIADSFYETSRGRLQATFKGAPQEATTWVEGWADVDASDETSPYRARILEAAQSRLRDANRLGPGAEVRFISPWAAPLSHIQSDRALYAVSNRFATETRGFLGIAVEVTSIPFAFRLADAVALAASEVHDAGRRRAVVILLGDVREDESLLPPVQVRAYLRQLQVPLLVWSVASEEPHPDWGEMRHVGFHFKADRRVWPEAFEQAGGELRRRLAAQRVVWLEGRHLPQSIELGEAAAPGLSLAGGPTIP